MSEKTKVTHITRYAYPHIGGIEAVISQINESLPDELFEKEVICCSNTEKSSIEKGVKYNRCKFLFEFAANTISPEFIWKLSRVNTDILHYHMPFIFAVIAHFIARPKYKKLYITYHGAIVGYDKYMRPFWGIYKHFYKIADKIHVLSPTIINSDPILSENKEKCEIVPYGVDLKLDYNQEEVNKIKEKYKNKKIILAIGRFVKAKGFSYLIQAMQNVEEAFLLIIGDGPLKKDFESYINENNLKDKVILLGSISDKKTKNNYIQASDIFVSSSQQESFGIVLLEAMRLGKPIINTNLGTGVNYVSIHNETGITVEPKDSEELANAMNKLIQDNSLSIILGQNSRKRVENIFSFDLIKDRYKNLYDFRE
ncbi:MAG TPA: glycosyltransferase [Candidatus Adamsella sp.]|nr:glycosyltransferase [Candidatus Adamsella sp.]